jgi:hypothetical protein
MEQETFQLLAESAEVRVGARSLTGKDPGIEVLARLHPPGGVFDPRAARAMLEKLDHLLDRGYQLTAQEGWWVVCERSVRADRLPLEASFALDLFADVLGVP